MELRWTDEGRECAVRFHSEAEARQCAEVLKTRAVIKDLQLLDGDGLPLEVQPSALPR